MPSYRDNLLDHSPSNQNLEKGFEHEGDPHDAASYREALHRIQSSQNPVRGFACMRGTHEQHPMPKQAPAAERIMAC